MKKTVNINLGGLVFQIDEDAYERLNLYINTLKSKFLNIDERNEIIQDIEYRFAELFNEKMGKTIEVVSLEMVNETISTMGAPEDFDDEEVFENNAKEQTKNYSKKLFRDPDDRIFAGVISGISKYLGIKDAIWLRIAMVLFVFAGFGTPFLIYLVLWIVTPYAKTASDKLQMHGDLINIENIENQVKKNINSEEFKRTTAMIADKASDIGPVLLKVLGVFLAFIFGIQLLGITIALFGGGLVFSSFNSTYINLIVNSAFSYYVALLSLYFLVATPLAFALYLAIKILTKRKVNWLKGLAITILLMFFAFAGLSYTTLSVIKDFKAEAEQTNFVILEDPTVEELNIEFPYNELKDDVKFSMQFGYEKENVEIEGIKVYENKKEIHLNAANLDIVQSEYDTIFKLSKTIFSKGKTTEDAEERLQHISTEFENINENTIAIPKMIILEDETKWREQKINYKLEIPIGKKIYFGENARKLIDDVDFNGDYSRKDLSNNTWEMTKQGLKCISCDEYEK